MFIRILLLLNLVLQILCLNVTNNSILLKLRFSLSDHEDLTKFSSIFEQLNDINVQTKEGWTVLHYAVRFNVDLEIFNYLLEKGSNVNIKTTDGVAPLMLAAQYSDRNKIQSLSQYNAKINETDKLGRNVLHYAARNKDLSNFAELVKLGADINAEDDQKQTPVFLIVKYNTDYRLFENIFSNKSNILDIFHKDRNNWTVVHYAARYSEPRYIQVLLDSHERSYRIVDEFTTDGWTPFLLSARYNNVEATAKFFGKHPNTRARKKNRWNLYKSKQKLTDRYDRTHDHMNVFELAILNKKHNGTLAYLLQNVEDNIIPFEFKFVTLTPETIMEIRKFFRTQYFLNGFTPDGINIDTRRYDYDGYEIHTADSINEDDSYDFDDLKVEIRKGEININDHDLKRGYTLLHRFIRNVDEVKFLLENGADINAVANEAGKYYTPLHIAIVENSTLQVLKLLDDAGAIFNATSLNCVRPLHLAIIIIGDNKEFPCFSWKPIVFSKYFHVMEYILSRGVDINEEDENGWTAIHYAARSASVFLVRYIHEHGGILNKTTHDGMTALHIVVQTHHGCNPYYGDNTIDYLTDNGLNVNDVDKMGWTPLHYGSYHRMYSFRLGGKNADLKAITLSGETVIQTALLRFPKDGDTRYLKDYFIERGVNVNHLDNSNTSALHKAIDNHIIKAVPLLLDSGADIYMLTNKGLTPLELAIRCSAPDIIIELIKNGADLTGASDYAYTQYVHADETCEPILNTIRNILKNEELFDAIENYDDETVEIALLENEKVNVSVHDLKNDWTLLQKACGNSNYMAANILIQRNANATERDKYFNWTPLHSAIHSLNSKMVELLYKSHTKFVSNSNTDVIIIDFSDFMDENMQTKLTKANIDEIAFKLKNLFSNNIETDKLISRKVYIIERTNNSRQVSQNFRAKIEDTLKIVQLILRQNVDVNAKDKIGWTPLHYAVEFTDNLKALQLLLDNGADVNSTTVTGAIALHLASKRNIKFVELLLNKDSEINASDKFKWTPLHYAILDSQNIEIVELLLERGADIKARQNDSATPLLLFAKYNNKPELGKILLGNGADINEVDDSKWSALHFAAAFNNNLEIIEFLMDQGADISGTTNENSTPLALAIKYNNNSQIIQTLVNKGSNLNVKQNDGLTPIMLESMIKQRPEILTLLLEKGANIGDRNDKNQTVLHIAAQFSANSQIVKILLEAKSNVKATTTAGWTPLHFATSYNTNADIVKLLLDYHSDVHQKIGKNYTPLQLAIINNAPEIVIELLKSGADGRDVFAKGNLILPERLNAPDYEEKRLMIENILLNQSLFYEIQKEHVNSVMDLILSGKVDANVRDLRNDWSPLHKACEIGNVPIIRFLLQANASIKSTDKYKGWTPLHVAAGNGQLKVVELLGKEKEIDINSIGKDGVAPIHIAASRGHNNIITFLVNSGGENNIKNKDGMNSLHYAVQGGQLHTIKYLQRNGYVLIEKTANGSNALHIAALNGHENIVDYLIEESVDVNVVDKKRWGPLHYAAAGGNLRIIEKLLFANGNIDERSALGETILQIAVQNGNENIAEYLLEYLDINGVDYRNFTALHYAVESGNRKMVEFLLREGANINADNNPKKMSPLKLAIQNNFPDIVTSLIINGAQINGTLNFAHQQLNRTKNRVILLGIIRILKAQSLFNAIENSDLKLVKEILIEKKYVNVRSIINDWMPLHAASEKGNLDIVQYLLRKNAKVNATEKYQNWTPFHVAVKHGNLTVIKLLLEWNSNVNSEGKNGVRPIHLAAKYGNSDIVKFLLNKTNADIPDHDGTTPLHLASGFNKRLNLTKVLLENGANVKAKTKDNLTPLHFVVHYNAPIEIIESLLENGAEVNAVNVNGWNPLHFALRYSKNPSIVKLLIENGANVNVITADESTPLQLAIRYFKEPDIVILLLLKEVDVKAITKDGLTPLHLAARYNIDILVIQFLIYKGVEINAKDNKGSTALHYAIKYNVNSEIIQLLIEKGADVNITTSDDMTPLMLAIENFSPTAVDVLLRYKTNIPLTLDFAYEKLKTKKSPRKLMKLINILLRKSLFDAIKEDDLSKIEDLKELLNTTSPETDWTPLHLAVRQGSVNIVKYLLDNNVQINAKDKYFKRTPLHVAVEKGNPIIVDTLLSYGADINSKAYNGATPIHIAALNGHTPLVMRLSQNEGNISYKDVNGETALHCAAKGGSIDTLRYLNEIGNITDKTRNGSNALQIAVLNNQKSIVEYLIEEGLDVNDVDDNGWTTLHYASASGSLEILNILLKNDLQIDAKTNFGKTGLQIAAQYGKKDIIEYFLNNFNDTINEYSEALYYGAEIGNQEIVSLLLAKNATPNSFDRSGTKAIHVAAERGHTNIVKLFIELGISVDEKGANGWTPLHYASRGRLDHTQGTNEFNLLETVQFLFNKKATLNSTSDSGAQPIHVAAQYGHFIVTEFYLQNDINVDVVDKSKNTALYYAAEGGHKKVMNLLKNFGANVNASTTDG